jgi:hypothetical protein
MIPISSALQAMYQNGTPSFEFNVKFQILDRSYNILYDSSNEPVNPILDGEVTVDKYRSSVRDYQLKLVNTSGKYTWNPGNLIWLDKYIKIFYGVWVNGAWEWLPQGVFPISNPIAISKPGVNEVELKGSDKMAFLGKCQSNITVAGPLPNPGAPLSLSASGSGSSLPAGTIYVQCDYTNAKGRTTTGNSQASISVTAGQKITTTVTLPPYATGVGIYVGTSSNPLLLGTISSSGQITYSGTATTGLSATVSGNTITVTISALASASGAAALTTSTALGADIATAIKSVLTGIETLFNLDDTSQMQTVPYDMTWTAGTEYAKIIKDLADIISWEIFYDVNGYLRLRAPIDPTTTAPQMTLSASPSDFNLWGGAERQCDDTDLANYIVVNGGSTQTGFVQYILQDNNPNSPTSVQNIGQRVYLHNNGNPDPVITTQQLAQYRAQYEYKKRLQIVEKQNFDMFICPFMDFDDVYQLTDPSNGTSGKYQVVSFTLPLNVNGQLQSGYMWQVRSFS